VEKCSSKKARLAEEVNYELEQLQRLADSARELTAVPESERRPWDAAAAAKYVSDLCAGLENLCKRRCVFLNLRQPEGADSHSQVIHDFLSTPGLGLDLTPELALRLKKYMRFRHRFVHGYGFEVSWNLVEEPLRLLPDTVGVLAATWRAWVEKLPDK
jgi:uncharacterized protein YutE (UPF0331/DUF86 family)